MAREHVPATARPSLPRLALAAGLGQAGRRTGFPHKVVTIIVPYPAGGLGDILPRAMAETLTQQTGPDFIVDNRPGATQIIAARLAAAAKPDGATIFFGSATASPSIRASRNSCPTIP